MLRLHHVNLQRITGGGEVYTHALTRAFAATGARVTLYVHPENRLWDDLTPQHAEVVRVTEQPDLMARLASGEGVIVTQSPIAADVKAALRRRCPVVEFSHLPITSGRGVEGVRHCDLAVTVSRYCIGLLQSAGIEHVYPEPMYGTTEAQAGDATPIVAASPYRWDRRKLRDVVLEALEPLTAHRRPREPFVRRDGITLGVVSLLSTIKQFPHLFSLIAGPLASHAGIFVEIFGDGGYAQVRDIRRALAPLGDRVRFWGYQRNVRSIYPRLDYLLAGLPEKEALGLNVLEAQMCGTPVLAPRAAPFTETMVDGRSGFLYRDPREDEAAEFSRLIASIVGGQTRPDPRVAASEHLAQFSFDALVSRTRRLLVHIAGLKSR